MQINRRLLLTGFIAGVNLGLLSDGVHALLAFNDNATEMEHLR